MDNWYAYAHDTGRCIASGATVGEACNNAESVEGYFFETGPAPYWVTTLRPLPCSVCHGERGAYCYADWFPCTECEGTGWGCCGSLPSDAPTRRADDSVSHFTQQWALSLSDTESPTVTGYGPTPEDAKRDALLRYATARALLGGGK